MRTSIKGMGDPVEDGGEVREEGYQTGDGRYVLFDPKNPLAWIMSDWYGPLPDAADGERADDQGPAE